MKKRVLCAIIACAFTVSACGSDASSVKGTVTERTTEETLEETAVAEETVEETAEVEEASEDVAEEEVSLGAVEGNEYENTFFNMAFTLDSSWNVLNEQELLEMSGIVEETLDDAGIIDAMEDTGYVYDLYATSEDGTNSVNIILQKLDAVSKLAFTEEAFFEVAAPQTVDALTSVGFSNVASTTSEVNFLGEDHTCLNLSGDNEGVAIYEKQIVIKSGNYVAIITAGTYMEDTTDSVLALFHTIQ